MPRRYIRGRKIFMTYKVSLTEIIWDTTDASELPDSTDVYVWGEGLSEDPYYNVTNDTIHLAIDTISSQYNCTILDCNTDITDIT